MSVSNPTVVGVIGALVTVAVITGLIRLRGLIGLWWESHAARARIVQKAQARKAENDASDEFVISALYVYPVKSLRGVFVASMGVSEWGLDHDRQLMVVRPVPLRLGKAFDPAAPTHRFLTQRQCPSLTSIEASLPLSVGKEGRVLVQLSSDLLKEDKTATTEDEKRKEKEEKKEAIHVDVSPNALKASPIRYRVGIWNDVVDCVDVGDEAALFVRRVIALDKEDPTAAADARLVAVTPGVFHRPLDSRYIPSEGLTDMWTSLRRVIGGRVPSDNLQAAAVPTTGLNDGFPVLITSEDSLADLNQRLQNRNKSPIPMTRFRPNIVVRRKKKNTLEEKPFDEDCWSAILIGSDDRDDAAVLNVVKGCPRCKQSCTDQLTGQRSEEPLETLATFRALGPNADDVYFGQNAIFTMALKMQSNTNKTFSQASSRRAVIRVGDKVQVLSRQQPVWDKSAVAKE